MKKKLLGGILFFLLALINTTQVYADEKIPPLADLKLKNTDVEVGETVQLEAAIAEYDKDINYMMAYYQSPSKRKEIVIYLSPFDDNNNVYHGEYVIKEFDEGGEWNLSRFVVGYSVSKHEGGYLKNWGESFETFSQDHTFNVINDKVDDTPPDVLSLQVVGNESDLTLGDSVILEAEITDDLSGVDEAFYSYVGSESRRYPLTSSDQDNSKFKTDIHIAEYTEIGTHQIDKVYVIDNAGNETVYDANSPSNAYIVVEPTREERVAFEAERMIGASYKKGGDSYWGGFDNLGMVKEVFRSLFEYKLPSTMEKFHYVGESVNKEDIQEGDLVFFLEENKENIGIMIGKDQFVTVSETDGVIRKTFEQTNMDKNYIESRRVTDELRYKIYNADSPLSDESYYNHSNPDVLFIDSILFKSLSLPAADSYEQLMGYGEHINRKQLLAGDLVFLEDKDSREIIKGGIYRGDNRIAHYSKEVATVTTSDIDSGEFLSNMIYGKSVRITEDTIRLARTNSPLIEMAKKYVGTPYQYGGDSTAGFDSSGFVQYVFNEVLGFELPRTVSEQAALGQAVMKENLQEGDLVFFSKDEGSGLTHVAIYAGDDQIIHPTVSQGVVVGEMEGSSYWGPRYTEARRVEEQPELGPTFTHPLTEAAETHVGTP
ncbi:NlpC/P60 family protein, partial [Halobacillus faecis]|uniref:NlpC/P60 family protein n=1 Tax=Halobacillus faecis TaxID=360184 RepID=UPI0011BD9CB8